MYIYVNACQNQLSPAYSRHDLYSIRCALGEHVNGATNGAIMSNSMVTMLSL